ncbi:LamG-like jellyroll fold domain-containing protein [Verrucomicrobiota bacterium]
MLLGCTKYGETPESNDAFTISLRSAAKASFFLVHEHGAGRNERVDYEVGLVTGRWYHVLFTRDDQRKIYRLYLDGKPLGDKSYGSPPSNGEDTQLWIGSPEPDFPGFSPPMALFDDVRTYARVLRPLEIDALAHPTKL